MRWLHDRISTTRDLTRLFAQSGRWWLIPLVAVFSLTALLLVVVQVVEYVAPFVYTIF
jgi:hypothetical protein